jgi:hypothetical protein
MRLLRATPPSTGRRQTTAVGLLGAALLMLGVGCAQNYAITTSTGATIYSKGRPKLSGGWYLYRDADGQEQRINSLRVRSIEAQ